MSLTRIFKAQNTRECKQSNATYLCSSDKKPNILRKSIRMLVSVEMPSSFHVSKVHQIGEGPFQPHLGCDKLFIWIPAMTRWYMDLQSNSNLVIDILQLTRLFSVAN